MKRRISIVAGARPNFMKIAPVIRASKQLCLNAIVEVFHTGQHFDENMSEVFFSELDIPRPDVHLTHLPGSSVHPMRRIMEGYEQYCESFKPNLVVVFGDVDSTLACSLVAKKMGIFVAHVEAGLRSGDREMPEEINRICTDALSDILFASERTGLDNLLFEGYPEERIHFVGNVMIDNLIFQVSKLDPEELNTTALRAQLEKYCVVTLHRPSNVDDPEVMTKIMMALNDISKNIPIIFPVHPRTRKALMRTNVDCSDNIYLLDPLSYKEFLNLWKDSEFVITDSGGLQEETTALGVPCFTLRKNTERPITLTQGTNTLIGADTEKLKSAIQGLNSSGSKTELSSLPEYWDGRASERIIEKISEFINC